MLELAKSNADAKQFCWAGGGDIKRCRLLDPGQNIWVSSFGENLSPQLLKIEIQCGG